MGATLAERAPTRAASLHGVPTVEGLTFAYADRPVLHDIDLDHDELVAWIAERHAADAPVAVHCVTAAQLVVTLSALREAGTHPQDRIEHAAVVPDDSIAELTDLNVTVVTQPNFVAERGDQYLADIPAAELHELWRVASLRKAGVKLALSTDMPVGDGDPWACMRAAVRRGADQAPGAQNLRNPQ